MQLELTICVALAALFALIEMCDTRRNKLLLRGNQYRCFNEPICNDTAHYPMNAIRKLVKKNKKKWLELSGSVVAPGRKLVTPKVKEAFSSSGDENMCKTLRRVVRPTSGLDEDFRPRYIVNVKGFQQIITYDSCLDDGKECLGRGVFPNDYRTYCRQFYTTIRLIAINSTGDFEYRRFNIPSACACSYEIVRPKFES